MTLPLRDKEGRNTTYKQIHEATLQRVADEKPLREAKRIEDARKTAEYLAKLSDEQRKPFDEGKFIVGAWFGDRPAIYGLDGVEAAVAVRADQVWPGGGAGFSLTGAGQNVAIFDRGSARATHQEFQGRVANITSTPLSDHATWVASTIAAGGVNPLAKGLAYQANVKAYHLESDEEFMATAVAQFGVRFSNHSYSEPAGWESGVSYWVGDKEVDLYECYLFGFYGNVAASIDGIVQGLPYYLPVWSAGNDRNHTGTTNPHTDQDVSGIQTSHMGPHRDDADHNQPGLPSGYDTVKGQPIAKNVMTVGAIVFQNGSYQGPSSVLSTPYSNWGPADDGRIKPDVVALGEGVYVANYTGDTAYLGTFFGTSASAPIVTGGLVLLSQHHGILHPTWRPLWGSTYKALLIHTALEAGAVGPDYKFGWGLVNIEGAAQLMQADADSGNRSHIKEVTLHDGDTIAFTVTANGTGPLKVTICWTDPGYPSLEGVLSPPSHQPQEKLNPTVSVLVNNLDLRVLSPAPVTEPWVLYPSNPTAPAGRGDNNVDNAEQFVLDNPGTGTFQVQITADGPLLDGWNGSLGSQNVSIILSGIIPQSQVDTVISSAVINPNNADEMILQWDSIVGQTYQILYFDEVDEPAANWQTLQTVNATHETTAAFINVGSFPDRRFLILKEDN